MALSRTAEWCWILVACLLLHLSFSSFQPVTTRHSGLAYDGQQYFNMAKQTPRDVPPKAVAPFVYRVGTPMVAAALAKPLGWVLASGFDRLNVAAALVTVVLLTKWLRRHVADAWARLLVVIFFMVEPHSPMRFTYYYPIYVDPAGLMFIMAGLLSLDWLRERPTMWRVVVVTALVAVGVAFRELVLIVGVMALALGVGQARRVWVLRWLPLAGGVGVLLAIRAWVVVLEAPSSDYSTLGEILRWLREKSVVQYGLAWFLVYGPMLTLVLVQARASLRTLMNRPDWLVGLTAVAAIALFGGSDTERLLVFASPFLYLLIAQALIRSGISMGSPVMSAFVLAQLVSSRVFVPIGGPPSPPNVVGAEWNRLPSALAWSSTYDSLWTQFCGSSAIRVYLVWFGVLAAGIVLASRLAEPCRSKLNN